jgi:Flp pilus assembly protein TadB
MGAATLTSPPGRHAPREHHSLRNIQRLRHLIRTGVSSSESGRKFHHPTLQRGKAAGTGASHPAVDGITVDQSTIIAYAVGYIAAMFGVILLYLPLLVSAGLLLLLVGTITLVVFLLKMMTVGLYRFLAQEFRTPTGRLHGGPGGRKLLPH